MGGVIQALWVFIKRGGIIHSDYFLKGRKLRFFSREESLSAPFYNKGGSEKSSSEGALMW